MNRLLALGIACSFVAIVGASAPAPASADPIIVSIGSLTIGGVNSWFNVSGPGYTSQGRDRDMGPAPAVAQGFGVFDLTKEFEEDFPLTQTTTTSWTDPHIWLDASFKVGVGDVKAGLAAPFQMSGIVTAYSWTSDPSKARFLYSLPFEGTGMAHLDVSPAGVPTVVYEFGKTAADVEPASNIPSPHGDGTFGDAASVVTPEPASLLLLASGLAFGAFRLRRKKA